MTVLVLLLFVIGYLCIVLEEWLTLDKTIPALLMGVGCWAIIALLNENTGWSAVLSHHLSSISEILLFLLGAMTIVELIDLHKGFDIITHRIKTTNPIHLLWIIGILSFILSGILDNLTAAIVMASILRKLIQDDTLRKSRTKSTRFSQTFQFLKKSTERICSFSKTSKTMLCLLNVIWPQSN